MDDLHPPAFILKWIQVCKLWRGKETLAMSQTRSVDFGLILIILLLAALACRTLTAPPGPQTHTLGEQLAVSLGLAQEQLPEVVDPLETGDPSLAANESTGSPLAVLDGVE
jgi:hypothetical protein